MSNIQVNPLLSEVLRPQCLSDLIITDATMRKLERFVRDKCIMNVIFYGSPGIGKTTAAKVLLNETNADIYEINGSNYRGDKTIIQQIENFATTNSFEDKYKVVFIDEADKLSKDVQESLRYIIENTSSNCRYLMTVNDISKMTDAIQSRCLPICFDVPKKEINTFVKQAMVKYSNKLDRAHIAIDPDAIKEVIETRFPDFRYVANDLQSVV